MKINIPIFFLFFPISGLCQVSITDNEKDKSFLNKISQIIRMDKNLLEVNDKASLFFDKNNKKDIAYVLDIKKNDYTERILAIQKDNEEIEIFNNILPNSKPGLENNINIENKKNTLTIEIELVIARPVSYDYLSFSGNDGKLTLDTIAYYFRDYQHHNKEMMFSIRGDFKDKTDFGNVFIQNLDILNHGNEEKNFYTDLSQFKFEQIKYDESEDNFKSLIHNVALKHKTNDSDWILKNIDSKVLHKQCLKIPILTETVNDYNNLGYFLEQAGDYKGAIFILLKVIESFPSRTVAYINLGDAYFGLKNSAKAKEAYNTYITLMKKSGKETKIPKRVYDRIK